MKPLIEIYKELLTDLAALQNNKTNAFLDDNKESFPYMISAGRDQGFIYITPNIEKNIAAIARRIRDANTNIAGRYRIKEWNTILRRKFGPLLANIDLAEDINVSATLLKKEINDFVQLVANSKVENETVIIGAEIFADPSLNSIRMGPLIIENKKDWLERHYKEGNLLPIPYRRLKRLFLGEKLRARKNVFFNTVEDDIKNALERNSYVISVTLKGFSSEARTKRAERAAIISLTVISLLWDKPARFLERTRINCEPPSYEKIILSHNNKRGFSSDYFREGLTIGGVLTNQELEKLQSEKRSLFEISGALIKYIIDSKEDADRTDIYRCLNLAMLWFHEACKEKDDLIATAKFASCLDTLSGGNKKSGIHTILEKRLGWNKKMEIHIDGHSLEYMLDKIYSEARSQTLHGSKKEIFADWSSNRSLAEFITRHLLIKCLEYVSENQRIKFAKELSQ